MEARLNADSEPASEAEGLADRRGPGEADAGPPLLRAVEPLEHVPPVPGSLLETRRWQAKEVLVCGQDAIEVGDCNVKMVDIKVEGIAKRNESAGGDGVAHGRVKFVGWLGW